MILSFNYWASLRSSSQQEWESIQYRVKYLINQFSSPKLMDYSDTKVDFLHTFNYWIRKVK